MTLKQGGAPVRLVVCGAAGGVGRHVVTAAATRGHAVIAVARDEHAVPAAVNVLPVAADVRDTTAVAGLLEGAHAVLWCVGVTRSSRPDVGRAALPPLLAVMREHRVDRFVGVSGAALGVPGDDRGVGARAISAVTSLLAADVVADKAGEYAALTATDLSWTLVRPPRLVERAGRGSYRLGRRAPGLRAAPVAKADVALAMVDLVEERTWLLAAPFLTAGPPAARPGRPATGAPETTGRDR